MTHLGAGKLTGANGWVVKIGTVDGFEVWLTLGSALVGLLALVSTFDAWGFSTLETGCEQETLLHVTVTVGSLVDLEEVGDNGHAGGFEARPELL